MMYKKIRPTKTDLRVNKSYEGESIEEKIQRIVNNKEPITDSADIIYTDRADGVLPAYNIRTDRMEVALDAMDKVSKTHLAKREEKAKVVKLEQEKKDNPAAEATGGESGNPKV